MWLYDGRGKHDRTTLFKIFSGGRNMVSCCLVKSRDIRLTTTLHNMHGFPKISLTAIVAGLLLFSGATLHGQSYQPSLDMRILYPTDPVMIGGMRMLYYELVLTNFASDTIAIHSIRVVTGRDSVVVASFTREDLRNRFAYVHTVVDPNADPLLLRPGSTGILYIEIPVDKVAQPIGHVLEGSVLSKGKRSLIRIQDEHRLVNDHNPIILGTPLRGGPWVAIYDPAWVRGHRRVIYTTSGKARIPGRFAIDFMLVNDNGKYTSENEDVIANWFGYGADVLAVADGDVVMVRGDFQESKTISKHPAVPAEKATGNYIVLDIGHNHFAFYEHLKPGSIRVRVGQKIRKGEVIASLGFTGQTTGPHLHFHIADGNAPLGAEGIPFVFESFNQLGVYHDLSKMGQFRWDSLEGSVSKKILNERPVPNAVILFAK